MKEKEREVSNLLANLNSISVEGELYFNIRNIFEIQNRGKFSLMSWGGQLKIASDSSSLLLDPAQDWEEEVSVATTVKFNF